MRKYKVNDHVYWVDPDNDKSNGKYTITKIISDEIILISNGSSEAEVHPKELKYEYGK